MTGTTLMDDIYLIIHNHIVTSTKDVSEITGKWIYKCKVCGVIPSESQTSHQAAMINDLVEKKTEQPQDEKMYTAEVKVWEKGKNSYEIDFIVTGPREAVADLISITGDTIGGDDDG